MIKIPKDGGWHPIEGLYVRVENEWMQICLSDEDGDRDEGSVMNRIIDPALPVFVKDEKWIGQPGRTCYKIDEFKEGVLK